MTELGWGSASYESRWERGFYGQAGELNRAFSLLVRQRRQLADRRGLVVLLDGPAGHLPVLRLGRAADRKPGSKARLVPVQRLDRGDPDTVPRALFEN